VSFELAQKVADAILYEGYVLYPYRASSAKNQVRFQWGVVAPRGYSQASEAGGSEPWEMQTECLVAPGAAPVIDLKVRGLQLQARAVEEATAGGGFHPVEFLHVGGELLLAWDEGIERELEVNDVDLRSLEREGEREIAFELPGGSEVEELGSDHEIQCRIVRRRWPVSVVVKLSAQTVEDWLRLRVRLENRTPVPDGLQRDEALRRSLVSAHTLLAWRGDRDGRFVSLLDPPAEAAGAVASCVNSHTWPVLIGPEGTGDVVLSSPIILYDHPAIAPESPGDLCDATEIDEILTLRIMTLTDEEKRQARSTDPRARRIIDRADGIPDEILERLHGAVRSLRPVEPEIADWEAFLNPPGEIPPEEASLTIAEVRVGKGSRVRLRPSRRADSMDFFLAGRDARVEGVYRDVEDECYIAVTLADDDPTGDLHAATGRFFYFYPDEIEPIPQTQERG
jgi:hypothetical protein